jgi:hypothetical protein
MENGQWDASGVRAGHAAERRKRLPGTNGFLRSKTGSVRNAPAYSLAFTSYTQSVSCSRKYSRPSTTTG